MEKKNSLTPTPLPIPPPILDYHLKALQPLLNHWANTQQFPHSLLITGIEGVGKRSIGFFLAQWLFCKNKTHPLQPCNQCHSCKRAFSGNWVDFTEIAPETSEEGKFSPLKIDQLRNLKNSQGFGAFENNYRITLISHAESMTAQAANSILKILEEPPTGWILILTASDPSLLLPTLVSRCQKIRLQPLSNDVLDQMIKLLNIPEERKIIISKIAQGSWGRALQLTEEDYWEKRNLFFKFLDHPTTHLNPLLEWSSQSLQNATLLVDHLEMFNRDLVKFSTHSNSHPFMTDHCDGAHCLHQYFLRTHNLLGSLDLTKAFFIEQSCRLNETRRQLLLPVNRKVLLQNTLFPWVYPTT